MTVRPSDLRHAPPAVFHQAADPSVRRVALYSHDTQGLGHIRRNSLIAAALVADDPHTHVLLLTGAPEASALPLPPRTSVVTVPALTKTNAATYQPRSLPLPLDVVIAMRAAILEAALGDFAPHLLVVDKVPLGVHRELEAALHLVRTRFGTRTVLGLRDVLDDPSVAIREWEDARTSDVIFHCYDQVWVYTDPRVYDPALEYRWPRRVRDKVAYTGYLGRGRTRLLRTDAGAAAGPDVDPPFVLGLVGGGQDGAALSRAFVAADLPPGHHGVLVTGPYLDEAVRRDLVAASAVRDDLVVLDFVPDVPALIDRATAAVAMAGYNTVCELLDSGRPVLLAPRTFPRREQAIRAERLQRAGLADVLTPATLPPGRLSRWLTDAVTRPRRHHTEVDLDGLARIPHLVSSLVNSPQAKELGHALR